MKKTILAAAFGVAALTSFAQDDTNQVTTQGTSGSDKPDTVRIGNMVIIKKDGGSARSKSTEVNWKHHYRNKKVTTSWALIDLGLNNFSDKTNYGSAATAAYTGNPATPFNANDFKLRNGRSLNVTVWVVRQRRGLTRNNKLNLTYAFGIETNNYRFENNISFRNYGTPSGKYVGRDSISFSKNKLATSYFTVPLTLGFNTKPNGGGFTVNVGASVGYLYSSRNKQISDQRGKEKIKGNFDLQPWKLSYVAEVGVGGFKLYGSYSPNSMFKNGLDMRPYAVGIRLGGWD